MKEKNQRQFKNLFLLGRRHLSYALQQVYLLWIFSLSPLLIIGWILPDAMKDSESNVLITSHPGLGWLSLVSVYGVILLVGSLFMLYRSMLFVHRFQGPLQSVNAQIDEMLEGKYGINHKIRAFDELDTLVFKLNRLSEVLKELHPSGFKK